jgi:hypothetical protein
VPADNASTHKPPRKAKLKPATNQPQQPGVAPLFRRGVFGLAALCVVIANLPLAVVLYRYRSDSDTLRGLIGHAPGQFLFLLGVFPFIALLVGCVTVALRDLARQKDIASIWIGQLIARPWLYASIALCLTVLVVALDSYDTGADYADLQPTHARNAVVSNRAVLEYLEQHPDLKPTDPWDAEQEQHAERLRRYLSVESVHDPAIVDPYMVVLQLAEMAAVMFVAWHTFFWCVALFVIRVDVIRSMAAPKEVKTMVIWLATAVSLCSLFPALRSYTIAENLAVTKQTYSDFGAPAFVFAAVVLCASLLVVAYFSKLPEVVGAIVNLWPIAVSLALFAFNRWDPTTFRQYLGSDLTFAKVVMALILYLLSLSAWFYMIFRSHELNSDGGDG